MEIFIEHEFLIDFYSDYSRCKVNNSLTEPQNVLNIIFTEYAETFLFLDLIETDFKSLLELDPSFGFLLNYQSQLNFTGPFKTYFQKNDPKFRQALLCLNTKEDWHQILTELNCLILYKDDYQETIVSLIQDQHFKINFSNIEKQKIKSWKDFSLISELPIDYLIFTDNYLLVDHGSQKIQHNIIPFLNSILAKNKREDKATTLIILTKASPPPYQRPSPSFTERFFSDNYKNLKRLEKTHNLNIYLVNSSLLPYDYDFHDRYLFTNFSILTSGKGFNLYPYFKKSKSTTKIVHETILKKDAYEEYCDNMRMIKNYIKDIGKINDINNPMRYFPAKPPLTIFS